MPGQFDLRPVSEGGPYETSPSTAPCGNVRRMGDGFAQGNLNDKVAASGIGQVISPQRFCSQHSGIILL